MWCTHSTKSCIGAQLPIYDIETGKLFFSSHVFDGIQVHGFHSSCCLIQDTDASCCKIISTIIVVVYEKEE